MGITHDNFFGFPNIIETHNTHYVFHKVRFIYWASTVKYELNLIYEKKCILRTAKS